MEVTRSKLPVAQPSCFASDFGFESVWPVAASGRLNPDRFRVQAERATGCEGQWNRRGGRIWRRPARFRPLREKARTLGTFVRPDLSPKRRVLAQFCTGRTRPWPPSVMV